MSEKNLIGEAMIATGAILTATAVAMELADQAERKAELAIWEATHIRQVEEEHARNISRFKAMNAEGETRKAIIRAQRDAWDRETIRRNRPEETNPPAPPSQETKEKKWGEED